MDQVQAAATYRFMNGRSAEIKLLHSRPTSCCGLVSLLAYAETDIMLQRVFSLLLLLPLPLTIKSAIVRCLQLLLPRLHVQDLKPGSWNASCQ